MKEVPQLYQPEKYKVYLGNGRSSGLCTVWNEPETVFNKSKIIRDNSVILGTLYSRQGVSVILRNLALNPQIRTVYLWGNGARTDRHIPFGRSRLAYERQDDYRSLAQVS